MRKAVGQNEIAFRRLDLRIWIKMDWSGVEMKKTFQEKGTKKVDSPSLPRLADVSIPEWCL